MRDAKAIELNTVFNCFPIGNTTVAELAGSHHTIHQNITRFCVDWLNFIAEDRTVSIDDRNEAGISIAKDLHKIEEARAIMHRPVPYI